MRRLVTTSASWSSRPSRAAGRSRSRDRRRGAAHRPWPRARTAGAPGGAADVHEPQRRGAVRSARASGRRAAGRVYDDLDLPAGQIRVRPRGGSAGHRGVASIVAHVGAEFARVRVGIGRPPEGDDAADYVLAPLSAARARSPCAPTSSAPATRSSASSPTAREVAMNRFNMRVRYPLQSDDARRRRSHATVRNADGAASGPAGGAGARDDRSRARA